MSMVIRSPNANCKVRCRLALVSRPYIRRSRLQGGPKNEATTFSRISSQDNKIFAHIKASIRPTVNMSIMRVYSFYYLKWRHLVNRLLHDNATLILQHHSVGWRLAHSQDERCVCRIGRRPPVNISDEEVLGSWLRITASVQDATITSGRCSKAARRAPSHTARSCVISAIRLTRKHCDHQTTHI